MNINVRWFIRRDLAGVLAVERDSYGEEAWSAQQVMACMRSTYKVGIVADMPSREIAGYMIYGLCNNKFDIFRLAVHPKYRRTGVGRGLLGHLQYRSSQSRQRRIVCLVEDRNVDAQLFLSACGFKCTEIVRDEDAEFYRFSQRVSDDSALRTM